MITSAVFAVFLTILTAEIHLLNVNQTLHPFRSNLYSCEGCTSESEHTQVVGNSIYPFSRGKHTVPHKYGAGFLRRCDSFRNCTFTANLYKRIPETAGHTSDEQLRIFLHCDPESGKCSCEEYMGLAYAWNDHWEVHWDPWNSVCRISSGGPCGYDRGLAIGCGRRFECLHSKCRNPSNAGNGKLNSLCDDDHDCLEYLICEYPVGTSKVHRQCLTPKMSPYHVKHSGPHKSYGPPE